MAAARAHAELAPRLFDAEARRARRYDEDADARLRFVGAGPDRVPGKNRRAGRIDFAAAERPAVRGAARDRRWQSAADRRSKLGLDPERVDERAVLSGGAEDLFRERRRKAADRAQRSMKEILLREHEAGRGLAARDGVDHAVGAGKPSAPPAELARNDERSQAASRAAARCWRTERRRSGRIRRRSRRTRARAPRR